jgi:hypothetical protein
MSGQDEQRIFAFIIAALVSYVISNWVNSIAPATLDPNVRFIAQVGSFFLSMLIFYDKVRLHIMLRKTF